MNTIICGMGEVGKALYEVLSPHYPIATKDTNGESGVKGVQDIVHICFPYTDNFIFNVIDYITEYKPQYVVIHSSVPVGTTREIGRQVQARVFHSPIRGKHPNIIQGLIAYVKYVSFDTVDVYDAESIVKYFEKAKISAKSVPDTRTTELGKLLSLCRYGVNLAFAKEQEIICEHFGVDYFHAVTEFERTRNEGLDLCSMPEYKQPVLFPFQNFVGGHCTVEDMEILLKDFETPLLKEAYIIDRGTKIWGNCNIYTTAKIGKGCSIGQFCEIGKDVVIGNGVRIGAFCFIPEGVTIEDNVFIAPKVSFANDKHPPSGGQRWGKTIVKKGAIIGLGAVILPDVTIGENAIVGAGSVLTKSIPPSEVWYGNIAAFSRGKKEDIYEV